MKVFRPSCIGILSLTVAGLAQAQAPSRDCRTSINVKAFILNSPPEAGVTQINNIIPSGRILALYDAPGIPDIPACTFLATTTFVVNSNIGVRPVGYTCRTVTIRLQGVSTSPWDLSFTDANGYPTYQNVAGTKTAAGCRYTVTQVNPIMFDAGEAGAFKCVDQANYRFLAQGQPGCP